MKSRLLRSTERVEKQAAVAGLSALQGHITDAPKGHKNTSLGQRPRNPAADQLHALKGHNKEALDATIFGAEPCSSHLQHQESDAYTAGILKQWKSPALVIGGVADHVHVLFSLSKNYALAKIVEEVKKGASKWLKKQGVEFRQFHWQAGYGAFSVSQSMVQVVRAYIENQERHHRRRSFQDEFRAFSRKHGIEFDERSVWD